MNITIDCRKRDTKAELVPKYTNEFGTVIQHKPIRKLNPDINKLSPLAKFIVQEAKDHFIGGMLLNGFLVRVEGKTGSLFDVTVKEKGLEETERIFKIWSEDKQTRASIKGWLFPVFEPFNNETDYFNNEAEKILSVAGSGGRVIINKKCFEIS
jgi:hypothetical protein